MSQVKASVLLLLAAVAVPPIPAAAAAATRDAVASPHATMRELGQEPRSVIPRTEVHEQRRRFAAFVAASTSMEAAATATTPSIPAPPVTAGFMGSIDLGASPSDAGGAAGPNHLLHTSNASVMVHDRAGNVVSNVTLAQFWHDPAFPDGALYDSRVAYDAGVNRWIIVTLYDLGNTQKSTLLVGVSDGGDPSKGWRRYRYIVDPLDLSVADYTRLALTRDAIVVTANIFPDANSSAVYMIQKSDLYAGPPSLAVTVQGSPVFDLVPVEGRDDTAEIYFAEEASGSLRIHRWTGGGPLASVRFVQPPLGTNTTGVTNVCPQLGSTFRIDCADIFATNGVLRNGVIWVAGQEYLSTPIRASVLWWRVPIVSGGPADAGVVDDPTGQTMCAFPSIAVNRFGAALIAFSLFNASRYVSAGYSYIDPQNHFSAPAVLKDGEGVYHNSRWADFSSTVVDPANDTDFWTVQTYPKIPGAGLVARWATWWGKIAVPVPAPARRRAAHH
jgi:hypothetical protein